MEYTTGQGSTSIVTVTLFRGASLHSLICSSSLSHSNYCNFCQGFPKGDNTIRPPTTAPAEDSGLSNESIRDQLAKVLASPEFAERAVLRSFLSFVVEKSLAGRSREIKEYTVAIEVFGKNDDFDGQKDSIVRIQAGRLRRALERYYLSGGAHDTVRIEIPKGSYGPIFRRVSAAENCEGAPLLEMVDSLCITQYGPVIAVMPLMNLTGDPAQEYFCDGLTEEFTSRFARFQGIRVVASYSTIQMKGEKTGARELGQRLRARFLVEGGLRREADNLKFSVRLIDTTDGLQIWGEEYLRELKAQSLIALQEDIASRVAGIIGDLYGVIPTRLSREFNKKPVDSLNTYDAFLNFHQYNRTLSPESLARAFTALQRAVTEDPESGLAWSLFANLHANMCVLGTAQVETLEAAVTMARKGVSLEPGNQWVRAIHAEILFFLNDRERFFQEATASLALNPNNPTIVGFIGLLRALYDDWEHGLALMEKAIELNPFFPGWYHAAPCLNFFRQGRYQEALQSARLFNMPQLFWDPLLRAAALGQLGRLNEAGMALAELLQLRPDFSIYARRLLGYFVKAADLLDDILDGLRKAGLTI